MTFHSPEFFDLYQIYTSAPDSVGVHLTEAEAAADTARPLIVTSGTDVAIFRGDGTPPQIESFRMSTRGFIEMGAISHLGPALAALVRMRQLDESSPWRDDARRLLDQLATVRAANTAALWRDKIAVEAWRTRIEAIVDMTDYACELTSKWLRAALDDPARMDFETLRRDYLETKPVPYNHVMIATFTLTSLDVSHRMIGWIQSQSVDWARAMVLVSGQSGRTTAGLTSTTNNMCYLIIKAATGKLAATDMYIAPFSPALDPVTDDWPAIEKKYRDLWHSTRANVGLSKRMFPGHPPFEAAMPAHNHVDATTRAVSFLPAVKSKDDLYGFVSRMRFVLEDPTQLISNCVADYVVDRLIEGGNRPENVEIPGLDFPRAG